MSESTRRIDQGEKRDAYLAIPSLNVYLLLEQDTAAAVAYRRGETGFQREVFESEAAAIELGEVGAVLGLAEVYEGSGV